MIHRKREGERAWFGINWDAGYYVGFILLLKFPYWINRYHLWSDFCNYNLFMGEGVRVCVIGFRIRNIFQKSEGKFFWKPRHWFCRRFALYEEPYRTQRLVATREELEDGIGFTGDLRKVWAGTEKLLN